MNILYAFFTLAPGFTLSLLMIMSYFRYRNIYFGLFTISYLGTGIMALTMMIKYDILGGGILIAEIIEMLCMVPIIYGCTWLLIKLFYDGTRNVWKVPILIVGFIPLFIDLYGNTLSSASCDDFYNLSYMVFFGVLAINCLIFGLNYQKNLQEKHTKFSISFWVLVLVFLLIFIVQRVTQIDFNPLFIFYFFWTVLLLWYAWKNVVSHGIEKLFHVQPSFAKQFNLTKREEEIIELIMKGHTNNVIGEILFISEKTVTNHIYNIYKKLNIHSRFELICLMK